MPLTLKHNGNAVDLAAARCELGSLTRSLREPDSLTLRRAIAFDEPTDWQNEDIITLDLDGTTLFRGPIKASLRLASPQGEFILYTCRGPRAQADAIPYQRTIAGVPTPRIVYNCPIDDEPDEAANLPLPGDHWSVGDILADILDSMAAPLAGIIGTGQPGSGYLQEELDALDAVPPKIVLASESVDEAIRRVLHFAPGFAFWVDPATHKARFLDLTNPQHKLLRGIGGDVLRHHLRFSSEGCFSACTVLSGPELVDTTETLTPAWNRALEADWTSEKAEAYPDTYGLVWRLFATTAPAAEGGCLEPGGLFVSADEPFATITISDHAGTRASRAYASVYDDSHLLLDTWARERDPATGAWRPATVRARFVFRKPPASGRFPPTGHTGTAHTRRGLTRELFLLAEDRGKKSIRGRVDEVLSPTTFRVRLGLALPGHLAGATIEFNANGTRHTIAANDAWTLTLAAAPQPPLAPGHSFVISVQDDTLPLYEGGTLSLLQKYAKECLKRLMNEVVSGTLPLAGLDWSLRPGIAVSFSGTNDPDYEGLAATVLAVEHHLAHQRTILTLGTGLAPVLPSWGALARMRRRIQHHDELRRQLLRLRRRHRHRRRIFRGAVGDPHELDPRGPIVGDGVRIDVLSNCVTHIGPGPAQRTIGGSGQYIQWVTLDLRGHLVDAGVGTFS